MRVVLVSCRDSRHLQSIPPPNHPAIRSSHVPTLVVVRHSFLDPPRALRGGCAVSVIRAHIASVLVRIAARIMGAPVVVMDCGRDCKCCFETVPMTDWEA